MKCDRCRQEEDCVLTQIHSMAIQVFGNRLDPKGMQSTPIIFSVDLVLCHECRFDRARIELSGMQDPQSTKDWILKNDRCGDIAVGK